MVVFNKYNCFVENVAEKVHNLGTDVLKIALSNTVQIASATVFTGFNQIATGSGYITSGFIAPLVSSVQTGGLYRLILGDPQIWTGAAGGFTGAMAPFQYAGLHNSTAANGPLIGWWDYGSPITLNSGETFTIDLDQVNGVLTIQ